ncbi:MAG: hypothetical protein IJO09_07380 [Oscillospiraceae bacterium]|nr:hypothetical protein [Oscillospiraceae bacterium]
MNMKPFCKGMTAGLIVGSTLAIALMPKKSKSCKVLKHGTGKILKSAGNVIDNLQSIL